MALLGFEVRPFGVRTLMTERKELIVEEAVLSAALELVVELAHVGDEKDDHHRHDVCEGILDLKWRVELQDCEDKEHEVEEMPELVEEDEGHEGDGVVLSVVEAVREVGAGKDLGPVVEGPFLLKKRREEVAIEPAAERGPGDLIIEQCRRRE